MNNIFYRWSSLSILLLVSSVCFASQQNPLKPLSNRFARLQQKAQERYAKSDGKSTLPSDQPAGEQAEAKEAEGPDVAGKNVLDSAQSQSKPLLAQHEKFSSDWWDALFGSCTGRRPLDSDQTIDCEKMLNQNSQWKEVTGMRQKGKRIVMQEALRRYSNEFKFDICNVACAVCAGGDPNEREPDNSHTALHMSTFKNDYGLFNLLLRKGANPNGKCQPAFPLNFVPAKWENELRQFGATQKEDDHD